MTKPTFYIIDGSAYIYRAYHAISPLSNAGGLPTHAAYGFTNILLRVIREKEPELLAIAFDAKGPNFRHEMYEAYKANRPAMPEDLSCQIPYIKDIVSAYNIASLEKEGVEADDLIAAAAVKFAAAGHPVVIISGDKDLLQLISDKITLWDPMSDKLYDVEAVEKKYQVRIDQLTDFFALVGDKSDNVPGVAGIGPKSAETLIREYGDLDGLYANLDAISKPKMREKLAVAKDDAFISRRLITLKEDVELPADAGNYTIGAPDMDKLRELFTYLGFTRLLKTQVTSPCLDKKGYTLVRTIEQLTEVAAKLAQKEYLVLDTETTSLDPLVADLVGISLCGGEEDAFYVPVGHLDADDRPLADQLDLREVEKILQPLFANPDLPKIAHNIKFDMRILEAHDFNLQGEFRDTMIASYLLDPSRRSHRLDDLAREILHKEMTSYEEVTGKNKKDKNEYNDNFAYVDLPNAGDYSCEDVHATLLLWKVFEPELVGNDLWQLFTDVEMEVVPVLTRMEKNGIKVDPEILTGLSKEFDHEICELEGEIHRLAGEAFNINSPKQLCAILFDKLKLPQGRKTKTGYSTDVKVLEKLAAYHDLPAAIIAHRNLSKLKSTYVDSLLALIHLKTGRIHTSFNQTVTATGRLSSSNPNLQNIPIRTREGQRIREAFIAETGYVFLAADYSQIDLRVLAHYSRDQALLDAFRSGKDIHNLTAAEIFRVNENLITDQMRRVAKTINFGIVYGMSAFGLASQLNLSRKEAAVFIERYFEHYAGVKIYMNEMIEKARRQGYVTTLLKRRRLLPDINSSNKNRREFAERTAINTPIQGTAADIIKLATIEVERKLLEHKLGARQLLQIHDELVFEVPEAEEKETGRLVKKVMEEVMKLDVPLVINLSAGINLNQTK